MNSDWGLSANSVLRASMAFWVSAETDEPNGAMSVKPSLRLP